MFEIPVSTAALSGIAETMAALDLSVSTAALSGIAETMAALASNIQMISALDMSGIVQTLVAVDSSTWSSALGAAGILGTEGISTFGNRDLVGSLNGESSIDTRLASAVPPSPEVIAHELAATSQLVPTLDLKNALELAELRGRLAGLQESNMFPATPDSTWQYWVMLSVTFALGLPSAVVAMRELMLVAVKFLIDSLN